MDRKSPILPETDYTSQIRGSWSVSPSAWRIPGILTGLWAEKECRLNGMRRAMMTKGGAFGFVWNTLFLYGKPCWHDHLRKRLVNKRSNKKLQNPIWAIGYTSFRSNDQLWRDHIQKYCDVDKQCENRYGDTFWRKSVFYNLDESAHCWLCLQQHSIQSIRYQQLVSSIHIRNTYLQSKRNDKSLWLQQFIGWDYVERNRRNTAWDSIGKRINHICFSVRRQSRRLIYSKLFQQQSIKHVS